jgi:hypothetical protein
MDLFVSTYYGFLHHAYHICFANDRAYQPETNWFADALRAIPRMPSESVDRLNTDQS